MIPANIQQHVVAIMMLGIARFELIMVLNCTYSHEKSPNSLSGSLAAMTQFHFLCGVAFPFFPALLLWRAFNVQVVCTDIEVIIITQDALQIWPATVAL